MLHGVVSTNLTILDSYTKSPLNRSLFQGFKKKLRHLVAGAGWATFLKPKRINEIGMQKNDLILDDGIEKIFGFFYLVVAAALFLALFFDVSLFAFFKPIVAFDVILTATLLLVFSLMGALQSKEGKKSERFSSVFAYLFYFTFTMFIFYQLGFFRLAEFSLPAIAFFAGLIVKNIFMAKNIPKERINVILPALDAMAFGLALAVLYAIYGNALFFRAWIIIYFVFSGLFLFFRKAAIKMQKETHGLSFKIFMAWTVWTSILLAIALLFPPAKYYNKGIIAAIVFSPLGELALLMLFIGWLAIYFILKRDKSKQEK